MLEKGESLKNFKLKLILSSSEWNSVDQETKARLDFRRAKDGEFWF